MLTIREIKQRTEDFLARQGVANHKLDTDLLIAHSLGIKRLDIYLNLERPLTNAQLDVLRPLVKRRAEREPLQYILGCVEFAGLELQIDCRALIPRPETEELFGRVCERLGEAPQRILDLGTGTGAFALALADKYPAADVTAVDISADALALAQENAAALPAGNRIRFLQGNWWEPLPGGVQYDLIVSNPPYLTEKEMATAEPEVAAHEPHLALVSGADGLNDLRFILGEASGYLASGGLLALETGIAQHSALDAIAGRVGLSGERVNDLSGRPRFYFCQASAEI